MKFIWETPEEINMALAQRLSKIRKRRNLSQQALADAIFVSRSAVAKWEAGLGMPCEESMRALEEHFGVARDFFLTDKPDEVIVKKNIRTVKVASVFGGLLFILLVLFSVLLMASVMCSSYGLTSKMAAGKYFYDNPCIHNAENPPFVNKILWVLPLNFVDKGGIFRYNISKHSCRQKRSFCCTGAVSYEKNGGG